MHRGGCRMLLIGDRHGVRHLPRQSDVLAEWYMPLLCAHVPARPRPCAPTSLRALFTSLSGLTYVRDRPGTHRTASLKDVSFFYISLAPPYMGLYRTPPFALAYESYVSLEGTMAMCSTQDDYDTECELGSAAYVRDARLCPITHPVSRALTRVG